MSFQTVTVLFLALTTLVGCGEDVSKNKSKRPTAGERSTPQATADTGLVSSQIARLRGFSVISYTQEINFTVTNSLPTAYMPVPDMFLNDEGLDGKNVITLGSIGRPTVACGIGATFGGINGRVSDCSTKNKDKAVWNGMLYGANGEATWNLVGLTESSKEYWQDLRTGMIWTDVTATGNWCEASGNQQSTGIVNCETVGNAQSICSGANINGIGENIRWRLPTRGDYLQADLDGIRFVMKPGTASGSWTATMQAASTERVMAWVYQFSDGTLSAAELTSVRNVRCIGTPVR